MPSSSIAINRIAGKNFKGIKDLTVDFGLTDTTIFGANGIGKTTIGDMLFWLLFGKDSAGSATFEIKRLDENNQPIHRQIVEVEGDLTIDGRPVTLKRIYQETWQGVRGQETFTGHTTSYVINTVPTSKEGEYKSFVASICDEKTLRLLMDPFYFNRTLKWQERRTMLMDLCGDITDADVIASNPELFDLTAIIDTRTVEGQKKLSDATLKDTKKEIESLPDRIDEVRRGMPDAQGDFDTLTANQAKLEAKRSELQAQLARIDSGGEVAEKQKQIAEIDAKIITLKSQQTSTLADELRVHLAEVNRLGTISDEAARKVKRIAGEIEDTKNLIVRYQSNYKICCDAYDQVDELKFAAPETGNVCPSCLQPLPAEQVEAALKKAQEEFNLDKSHKLERAQQNGKTARENLEKAQESLTILEAAQVEAGYLAGEALKVWKEADEKVKEAQSRSVADVAAQASNPEIDILTQEKVDLESAISTLRQGTAEEQQKVRDQILKINDEINATASTKEKILQRQKAENRIEELTKREEELAKIQEKCNREIFLLQLFTRTKADLLTNRINSRFDLVKWKLFDVLVNQNIEDTCVGTINGIPYDGALSTSQRINAGLDTINAFSHHLGITAPCLIDNCESVTEPLPTLGQQIRLVVSEADEELFVVNSPESEAAHQRHVAIWWEEKQNKPAHLRTAHLIPA